MAKDLQTSVKLNTWSAEKSLRNLERRIQGVQKAIDKSSRGAQTFTQSISKAVTATNRLGDAQRRVAKSTQQTVGTHGRLYRLISNAGRRTREWYDHQRRVTSAARSTSSVLGSIGRKLKAIAATYLGIMSARGIINTSDIITSAQNKLNSVNANMISAQGGNAYTADGGYSQDVFDQTAKSMDKMYISSQKVRTGYTDMMDNVSKSMTLASKAFQDNTDNAIRFQEIMAEAYAVGGASAAEQSSSMYQLMQALGSGVLQGDELRSVREGAPLAYQAIEKFAQGVYKTDDALKEMAADGMITSDMVVAAIMNAGDELDKAFARTEQTFAQTWQQIKNMAVKAFEPVSDMMRKSLNNASASGLLENMEQIFTSISKVLQIIVTIVGNTIRWIADNWSWLQHVIVGGLIAIGMYFAITKTIAIASAIATAVAWAIAHWQLLLVFTAIFAIIYAFYLLKQGVIDTCTAIGIALLAIAAIMFLIFGWQVALVFAALALITMFFEYVCGGAMWLAAVIWDIIAGLSNVIVACICALIAIIHAAIAIIVNAVMGSVNWIVALIGNAITGIMNFLSALCNYAGAVAQNIGIAFSNGWNAAKSAFWNFIADCLDGLKALEPAINGILKAFGKKEVSFSATAGNLRGKAKGYQQKAYVSTSAAWSSGMNTYDYSSLSDAWSKGWNTMDIPSISGAWNEGMNALPFVNPTNAYKSGKLWGSDIKDKVNDWGSGLASKANDQLSLDNIGKKLGLDFGNATGANGGSGIFPNANDPANSVLGSYKQPSAYEPTGGLDDLGKKAGKTADNTGKIADSMELTQEDLEYLRRVADMEWKKEFTTANITVDMSNYNTINGENDLDGLVTKLTNKLYEELDSVANGVYV